RGAASFVELERRLEVGVGDGPAERLACQARHDLARARRLLGFALRATAEDALAARRVAQARGRERAVDLEPLDFQRALLALDDADLAAARDERLEHGV